MKMWIRILSVMVVGQVLSTVLVAQQQTTPADAPTADLKDAHKLFQQSCIKCHGPEKQKGKLRLDTLKWDAADVDRLGIWQDVVDQLSAGDMPPKEEPRPKSEHIRVAADQINSAIDKASATQIKKPVVLRRLNRVQYRNTIRDLLNIDVQLDDPTEAFPADDIVDGFDNVSEALMMSDFLMAQYIKAARKAVDRATFAETKPQSVTHRMGETKRRFNFRCEVLPIELGTVYLFMNDEREPGDTRGQTITSSRDGASFDGWYDFEFEVESRGRGKFSEELGKQKRNDWQVYRPEDLHRLEIYLSAPHGTTAVQTRKRHLVKSVDLPDNKRQIIKHRLWVKKGWRVEVAFGNGWSSSTSRHYPNLIGANLDIAEFEKLPKREQNTVLKKTIHDQIEKVDAPCIAVYRASETGPIFDSWPPASHKLVYGKRGQNHREIIRAFASRAFRRPVADEEIAPYLKLAKQSPEGIRTAIEGILCSPRFLYLTEPQGKLDDYAIASRLSYFLWSTMPDDTLLRIAAKKQLRDPKMLKAQVERMLSDARSDEFVNRFVWSWLKLQNTIDMAPDPTKFYEFRRNRIADAMVKETQLFFRHLLDKNLSLSNFIDSDFTFLNADLARLYRLPGVVNTTATFKKVSLKPEHRRGGLLGQASVLTASANGVDTSPVVRGIWILDNLLGTPPDPPPPSVEVPDPDTRGNLTIRELYAKHRTIESCNDCHKRIDPVGFALENYDPVGQWRTKYESGHAIDPSGTMTRGETFDDVMGMKRLLAQDIEVVARNLTSKLLTYAIGRTMTTRDRTEIDRIVQHIVKSKYRLRDLIHEVVRSDNFLEK